MIVFPVVLFCLIGASPAQKLHEKMTPGELLNIFHTTNNVPEYEVVPIFWPKLQKRSQASAAKVALTAFGEDIKLQLNPVNGVLAGYNTPIYMARKKNDTFYLAKYPTLMKDIHSQMFEDFEKGATIVVSQQGKKTKKIVGTISSMNLAIKSLPKRLASDVIKQRRLIDNATFNDDYHYHIIHKINNSSESINLNLLNLKAIDNHGIPDTIYPEILVVVDHGLYKKLGGNAWEAVPYLLAFWNGVDIKYRSLKNPEWRLNIAGIVLAEDPVIEYIEKNNREEIKLVASKALQQGGNFWYKQNQTIPVTSYDLVATMTSQHMCHVDYETQECKAGILGLAFMSSVCRINEWSNGNMNKVAMIHDDGTYMGIHVAAHELGHLFGAEHDEKDNCSIYDGFIMAATQFASYNSSYWSSCSKKNFDNFLKMRPTCVYNKPYVDNNLPTLMPGKYLDVEQQCIKGGYRRACDIDADSCKDLKCIPDDGKECRTTRIVPVDGTKCGDDKFCFRQQCVDEIKK